ncbi:MAG: MFS transporter [Deltaproteobacteria bacterium]|nr:MFS transporter [Deltaproteobacteria bacterium]
MSATPDWLRSFRQPNYRRYFIGQSVSMVGTFMQFAAIPWVVWELTHSARWLGAANFLHQIPFLVLGLVGGAIADRCSRRGLIAVMQCLALLQATSLAFLATTGMLTLPPLVALVLLGGTINAIDFPARQAFTMDLVGPEDLPNAIALNATLVHTMRVLGPVVAGIVLAAGGAGYCFTVNAATYVGILAALKLIDRAVLYRQTTNSQHLAHAVRAGFRIVWQSTELRRPLCMVACCSFAGGCYLAFLPYFADHIFHGGPRLLGFLFGTSALGALTGATLLARARRPQLERWLVRAGVLLALSLITFVQTRCLALALPMLFGVGCGFVLLVSGTNTLVQLRAPAEARGRVVSYLTTAFFGLTPLGSLAAGYAKRRASDSHRRPDPTTWKAISIRHLHGGECLRPRMGVAP